MLTSAVKDPSTSLRISLGGLDACQNSSACTISYLNRPMKSARMQPLAYILSCNNRSIAMAREG
jgi:hypothetical protein